MSSETPPKPPCNAAGEELPFEGSPYTVRELARMGRNSASGLGANNDCKSRSHANRMMAAWLGDPNSPRKMVEFHHEMLTEGDTARGLKIHETLTRFKELDFKRLNAGRFTLPDSYREIFQGGNPADEATTFSFLVQRDVSIHHWLQALDSARPGDPVVGFARVLIDDTRLVSALSGTNGTTRLSGQGDVIVVAERQSGEQAALVLDYKSGRGYDDFKFEWQRINNCTEQEAILAVLSAKEFKDVTSAASGLITPGSLNRKFDGPNAFLESMPPTRIVFFDAAQLRQKERELADMAITSDAVDASINSALKAGETERAVEIFMQNAKPGHACNYCNAIGSCKKVAEDFSQRQDRKLALFAAIEEVAPEVAKAITNAEDEVSPEVTEAIRKFADESVTTNSERRRTIESLIHAYASIAALNAPYDSRFAEYSKGMIKAAVRDGIQIDAPGIKISKPKAVEVTPLSLNRDVMPEELFSAALSALGYVAAPVGSPEADDKGIGSMRGGREMANALTLLHKKEGENAFAVIDRAMERIPGHEERETLLARLRTVFAVGKDSKNPDEIAMLDGLRAYMTPERRAQYVGWAERNSELVGKMIGGISGSRLLGAIQDARLDLYIASFDKTRTKFAEHEAAAQIVEFVRARARMNNTQLNGYMESGAFKADLLEYADLYGSEELRATVASLPDSPFAEDIGIERGAPKIGVFSHLEERIRDNLTGIEAKSNSFAF